MSKPSQQRFDIMQTEADFAQVMEDYFSFIPPALDNFNLEKIIRWEYEDIDNAMTFYFENERLLVEFKEEIEEIPMFRETVEYDEYDHIDWQNLTITMIGKDGGLM